MTAGESSKFNAKVEYYSSINTMIDMTQQLSQGHAAENILESSPELRFDFISRVVSNKLAPLIIRM